MAQPDRKQSLSRLMSMYDLGYDSSMNEIRPTANHRNKDGKLVINFEGFPVSVQKYLETWQNVCHVTPASFENRELLYRDMDTIYLSSPLLSRAMDLMADEVVQADMNFRAVDVEASPKVQDFLLKFHDDIGLDDHLRPTALSVIKYGNGAWVPGTDDSGVREILPVPIYDFYDRVEFSAVDVKKELKSRNHILHQMSNNKKPKMLIDNVMKKQNYESYLKRYLFGFQVNDLVLPPWKFIHFRNIVHDSPFRPFGQPMFIHSIASYRQYDAAMQLQMAARVAKFPIYKYELNFPTIAAPSEKLAELQKFINMFDNSGMHETRKEEFGIGERMFTIKDLVEFKLENPEYDLGRLDDIELLRDDQVLSTGVPRNYLDPGSQGFGNSGINLSQQFKPFARKVYSVQSTLLEGISQLDKIHMILSGKFSDEEIDFQLTMPYPESQTDRDMISSQSDLLNLANSVLDSIAQRIVGDGNAILPPELVKDIYAQFLPYDTQRIDDWIQNSIVVKQDGAEQATGGSEGGDMGDTGGGAEPSGGGGEASLGEEPAPDEGEPKTTETTATEDLQAAAESTRRKINKLIESLGGKKKDGKIKLKEMMRNLVFEHKQKKFRNLVHHGKHIWSSRKLKEDRDFPAEQLWALKDKQIMKIKEQSKKEVLIKEEIDEFAFEILLESENEMMDTDENDAVKSELEDLKLPLDEIIDPTEK